MNLSRTIAFRLFVLIGLVVTCVLAVVAIVTVRLQENHMMENVLNSASRVSDVIARSTRYSMLLNRKEDVHQIIASIGGEPGIEGIRIYNKQGEIIFGTNTEDLHTTVDMNAEACVTCHASSGPNFPHHSGTALSRIFADESGERVLGLITPIRNEAQCSDAACHAHSPSLTVLGVLDVKMSLAQVDAGLAESRRQLLGLSALAVLVVALISGWFIWAVVHHPVQRMTKAMESVSGGNLDHHLADTSGDELGQLARTFNHMTMDLKRAREEITAWSGTLQKRVDEKAAELKSVHQQMLHVEKMASLGNLAATVAHELNNPLAGILTFAKLLIKQIQKSQLSKTEKESLCAHLTLVADEARRSGDIVQNLLVFARQKGGEFQSVRMKDILDRCALLIGHHAKIHNVTVNIHCPGDLMIECDPDQIQQAMIALMVNSIEAMSGPGRDEGGLLDIGATLDQECIRIRIRDTGVGMTEEVKAHMFEPFFTTKSGMKGVGLGLAVVYGIVQRHLGNIHVQSEPGVGTTFTITIPPGGTSHVRHVRNGEDVAEDESLPKGVST